MLRPQAWSTILMSDFLLPFLSSYLISRRIWPTHTIGQLAFMLGAAHTLCCEHLQIDTQHTNWTISQLLPRHHNKLKFLTVNWRHSDYFQFFFQTPIVKSVVFSWTLKMYCAVFYYVTTKKYNIPILKKKYKWF